MYRQDKFMYSYRKYLHSKFVYIHNNFIYVRIDKINACIHILGHVQKLTTFVPMSRPFHKGVNTAAI